MRILTITSVLFFLSIMNSASAMDFFVSPKGNDKNTGTISKPFASLERARNAVRAVQKDNKSTGGITVWLRGGVYPLTTTFQLTSEDSGTKESPVVYRAYGNEEVRITGGKEVKGWKPVQDASVLERLPSESKGKVLQINLKDQGITDYGKLTARGFSRAITPSHMELFFNDKPMELAGWPNNDGWDMTAGAPAGQSGGKFTYADDRPSRWTKADDIWLHGYWTWPWADSYEKVAKLDISAKEISTEPPHGVYGYQANKRWRALNLLEELDIPGEYYIDRKAGILYFIPPSDPAKSKAVVSILEKPMVSMKNTSYTTLRGFIFENCRGNCIEVEGGTKNLIAGCIIRNIGNNAVHIKSGTENGVQSCDIYNIADFGVLLDGGDRMTLTPAKNFMINCRVHDIARWDRTYRAHVQVSGVGNLVAHNEFYDTPHTAVFFHGNDHMIEFNEIYGVCMETGDAGAIYTGRNWSYQGNELRYNYVHDIGGYQDKWSSHNFSDTMGLYLDDMTSGTRAYGNIFRNVTRAMMIGGGRSNTLDNNIIIDCKIGLSFDDRGTGWAGECVNTTMVENLKAVNGTGPVYTSKYPALATILQDEPAKPKYNSVQRNIFVGSGQWCTVTDPKKYYGSAIGPEVNIINIDPLFVDRAKGNFQLRDDSPAFKKGFKKIPFDKIGLYADEYRKNLP